MKITICGLTKHLKLMCLKQYEHIHIKGKDKTVWNTGGKYE